MPAPAPEQDKKKAAATAAPKPKVPGAEVGKDKADLGAMMRPEAKGKDLEVGAANDKAEKEADKVAEAVVKEGAEAPEAESEKDGEKSEDKEKAPREVSIRGPPLAPLGNVIDMFAHPAATGARMVRRTAAQDSQPNVDSLSAVPALESNQAEVTVAPLEEASLEDISDGDWSQLSSGEGLQPKRLAGTVGSAFTLDRSAAQRIATPNEPGSGLAAPLRAKMEKRFDVDLGAVRVHTGTEATQLCGHIGARAFAHGANIWVRSVSDLSDTRLMAHEVAHTMQQGAAKRRPAPRREQTGRDARDTRRHRSETQRPPARAPPATTKAQVSRLADDEDDPGVLARGAERLADNLDSYGLLKVLIGRRLFTGETVNAGAVEFVGAFMKFLGADETFEQMKQSGSLEKGFDEIKQGLTTYDITWDRVKRVFARAEDEFDWWSPIESFKSIFGPFFSDVVDYGLLVLKVIARLIAEAFVTGFGEFGKQVWEKIQAIGENIQLVVDDPLGFAQNLIRAVSRGIEGFGERIWEHIKAGLLAWILGPFAAMGVKLPDTLDLKGIVSVILQVLGLTYEQLRPRIVKAMNPNGDIKVTVVERIIEAVNILRTEGLVGIWRKLMEYVENLQMTVINGIRDWVVRAVVQAGIRKLVAWSNPAGALIDILLTIYNLIVFFVERFQQILDFANSVFDSIGKIARGELNEAALAVEKTLALTIPVIISFLVKLLGLPDITGTVRKIVTDIREKVHKAFDKALEWIIKKIKKLISKFVDKFRKSTPSTRIPFEMDGEAHEIWAEDKTGKIDILMASGTGEPLTQQQMQANDQALDNSEDHDDAEAQTNQQQMATALRTAQTHADRLNAGNQTNRSTPAERDRLQQECQAIATEAEQLSQRSDAAAEPDPKANPDATPVPGEGATDRTDIPLRHVIRDTTKIEGTAGTWDDATGRWELAASSTADREDVYANLARDHVPEFALLEKIRNIQNPGMTRAGQTAPPQALDMFPNLLKQMPNKTKEANGNLPVIVIRTMINSVIGANSALLKNWEQNFDQDEATGKWVPKAISTANSVQALQAALTKIQTDYGPDQVIADSRTHFDDIKKEYNGLPANTVTEDFVNGHLETRAKPALDKITQNIFGPPDEAAAVPVVQGPAEDINIPFDPAIGANELKVAQYADLKDLPELNRHMQRHHLVEESVMKEFKAEMVKDTWKSLYGLLEGPDAMVDTIFTDAEAKLTADERQKLTDTTPLKAKRTKARNAIIEAMKASTISTGFKTKQGVHDRGIAVYVLNVVNRKAGNQPPANFTDQAALNLHSYRTVDGGELKDSLTEIVEPALKTIASGASFSVKDFQGQAKGTATYITEDLNEAIPRDMKDLMKDLVDTAYDIFEPLQTDANQELTSGTPAQQAWGAETIARFGAEASRDGIKTKNLVNWFE